MWCNRQYKDVVKLRGQDWPTRCQRICRRASGGCNNQPIRYIGSKLITIYLSVQPDNTCQAASADDYIVQRDVLTDARIAAPGLGFEHHALFDPVVAFEHP